MTTIAHLEVQCTICKELVHTFKIPAGGLSLSTIKELYACPKCGHTGGLKVEVAQPPEAKEDKKESDTERKQHATTPDKH